MCSFFLKNNNNQRGCCLLFAMQQCTAMGVFSNGNVQLKKLRIDNNRLGLHAQLKVKNS